MALSGTIYGAFTGIPTSGERPVIEWSASQSVSGNYSDVTVVLYFVKYNSQYYTYNLNGVNTSISIDGNSATASRTIDTRTGTKNEIWRRTRQVSHNDNGQKTLRIGASGSGGTSLYGTYSFDQNVTLDTIPRATTLSAFSFTSALRNGYTSTLSYTADKKSTSFRNNIQLRDGNTVIFERDNQNTTGTNTITLTVAEVNTLLNRMSNVTSKTFTLRVATRSGNNGGWIGSAVTRNASASVDSRVIPSASGMTTSIQGTGHDNGISRYIQGFTRVTGSFTSSAGYGASVSSRNIVVRRVSDGADSQSIDGSSGTTTSGTTTREVRLNGTYEAIGTVRDSRGRTNTSRTTFTVQAYTTPVISEFTATRIEATPTIVQVKLSGSHSNISGLNRLNYTIQRRQGSGAWTNISSGATGSSTSSTFSTTTPRSTGTSVTSSYEFRVVVTDQFGARVEASQTVSTQRVVLDVHKNEGVGIGKIHEQGVLDVDGDAYFKGRIIADRTAVYYSASANIDFNDIVTEWALVSSILPNGVPNNRDEQSGGRFVYLNTIQYDETTRKQIAYGYTSNQIWTRYSYRGIWSDWVEESNQKGQNNNGEWIRLPDGTQLCWLYQTDIGYKSTSQRTNVYRTDLITLNFPANFIEPPTVIHSAAPKSWGDTWTTVGSTPTSTQAFLFGMGASADSTVHISYLAIGRWM